MSQEKGSSLLEMIITLSIVMLLATASVSSFTATTQQYRVDLACRDFIQALALARSEAIKRNVRVTVRSNTDHWEDGWTIFADANGNSVHESEEAILHLESSKKQWIIMSGNNTVKSFVSYVPAGNTAQTNNAWQAGTFTLCPLTEKANGYKVIINRGGRVRREAINCET